MLQYTGIKDVPCWLVVCFLAWGMRVPSSIAIAALLPACQLVFVERDDDDRCDFGTPAAELAPAPLRDPLTLACQSFGPACDPGCEPCPEIALAPQPTWGYCGSPCEGLAEAACAASAECRVVKDARCSISGGCLTDFL